MGISQLGIATLPRLLVVEVRDYLPAQVAGNHVTIV
jgi:hypothetical protein